LPEPEVVDDGPEAARAERPQFLVPVVVAPWPRWSTCHDFEPDRGEGLRHPLVAEGVLAEAVGHDDDPPLRASVAQL